MDDSTNSVPVGLAPAADHPIMVLLIDDQPMVGEAVRRMLEAEPDIDLHYCALPQDALEQARQIQPTVILQDLVMPGTDGLELLRQFRQDGSTSSTPIIVLSTKEEASIKGQAFALGANDYLVKLPDKIELIARIRYHSAAYLNRLQRDEAYRALRESQQQLLESNTALVRVNSSLEAVAARLVTTNAELERALAARDQAAAEVLREKALLEERVAERTRDLEEAQVEILERLASLAEFRDDATGEHTKRVTELATALAEELGMEEAELHRLRMAAGIHDVGKVAVPDEVLLKPGKLTPDEFEVIKTHTTIGARILAGGRSPIVQLAEQIARSHHERWDGKGYPDGLAGEGIPLPARIVAVADVFDALTHVRPYKVAWSVQDAAEEIARQSGTQFDPQVVAAFLRLYRIQVPKAA